MRTANWLRKKLNQPVKFNIERAIEDAQLAAHNELSRLEDPTVVAEIDRWQGAHDRATDGIECDGRKR